MIFSLIIGVILFSYVLERILDNLNASRWSDELPEKLKDIYDSEAYRKAQQYDKANKRLSLISETFSLVIMLAVLITGAFGKLDDWSTSVTNDPLKSALLFFGILAIVSDVLNLPFNIYKTFVIEGKFGFNKTTAGTFITDKIKGYFLGALLGGSMLAIFILSYQLLGDKFWMYVWIVVSVFMIIIAMFYASWILPLFNKLSPLPEGELRNAIVDYSKKAGFALRDIFIMDGSRRSSKANAFFSGLGGKKKIVLFDTLINNHTTEELVAILAHETGHFKKKHTQTSMLISIFQTGFILFIFSLFISTPGVSEALGSSKPSLVTGLLAFGILYSPIAMISGILMNYISRKNEFEADNFATKTYNGKALIEALKKLSVNNLSNLDPHPAYVFMYYSHPPLLQRVEAIEKAIHNG